MRPKTTAMVLLGCICVLTACAPVQRSTGRDSRPDEDPLEANRPASAAGQRPLTPIMTQ